MGFEALILLKHQASEKSYFLTSSSIVSSGCGILLKKSQSTVHPWCIKPHSVCIFAFSSAQNSCSFLLCLWYPSCSHFLGSGFMKWSQEADFSKTKRIYN